MARLLRVTLVFAIVVSIFWAYSREVRGLWNTASDLLQEVRYGSVRELRDRVSLISYFTDTLGLLKPDARGAYELRYPSSDNSDGFQSNFARGMASYHQGDFNSAVDFFAHSDRDQQSSPDHVLWLSLALMRRAESENAISLAGTPRPTVLPVAVPYSAVEDTTNALELLTNLYAESKDPLHQWLVLWNYLQLGLRPEDIPLTHWPLTYGQRASFLKLFYGPFKDEQREKFSHIAFTDRASALGVGNNDTAKGVAVEDFDRDGFFDLVTGASFGALRYFKNQGGHHFQDITEELGLGSTLQPYSISAVDYDNDGWMDLFVSRPYHHYQLFRNIHGSRFEDMTVAAGLLNGARPSEGSYADRLFFTWHAAWADIDNDGDLDLFLSQWGQKFVPAGPLSKRSPESSRLFVNESGVFSEESERFGLSRYLDGKSYVGAAFGDYDGDGYQDLFLSSFSRNRSRLFRNNNGQKFVDSGLLRRSEPGYASCFFDINQDGKLDLFQSGNAPARTVARYALQDESQDRNANALFVQDKSGSFNQRLDLLTDSLAITALGVSYGDIDNNGCFDLYLGTGNPEGWFIMPNLMYMGVQKNGGCGPLENISMLENLGSTQKGQGVVFFDFDNDGDQDIYLGQGGMWPGDGWPNSLFVNESSQLGRWVKVRLRGHETNYYGVGAAIIVTSLSSEGVERKHYHTMNNKTGYGSTPYLAHIGLGDVLSITSTEVYWPGSSTRKQYSLEIEQLNILDEHDGLGIPNGRQQ